MTTAAAKIAELGQVALDNAPPNSTVQRVKPLAPLTDEQAHEARLRAIVKRCRAEPKIYPCTICGKDTTPASGGKRACWKCDITQDAKGNVVGDAGPMDQRIDGCQVIALMRVDEKGDLHITPVSSEGVLGDKQIVVGYMKRGAA